MSIGSYYLCELGMGCYKNWEPDPHNPLPFPPPPLTSAVNFEFKTIRAKDHGQAPENIIYMGNLPRSDDKLYYYYKWP